MKTLRLVIATTINAPADCVYAVLADLTRYPKIFRYMHDLRVVEQRDHSALAEIEEDIFGMMVAKVLTKFVFEPPLKVLIEQVKGPFERAVAWFHLEPQGEKTKVVHGAEITVGGLFAKIGMMLLGNGIAKARMIEELKAVKREAEKFVVARKT